MIRLLAVLAVVLSPAAGRASTIAIAYFDNNTGDAALDPLRKGFADMLITDLSNVSSLQIVERDKLNQVLGELKLSTTKFIDPKTAQKLGKGLAAEFIMTGSYVMRGDSLRVDVRVIQVKTGRIAASEKVEGKRADFFAVEKDLVDILIKTLDVKLSSGERGKLRSNATESFDAWQKYSAALDAKDRGDSAEAARLFQAALDADPNYRAAKTATERLQVIFRRDDVERATDLDKAIKGLDPKSPKFASEVDELLAKLANTDLKELRQKIALLSYLAEHDLTPNLQNFSRLPLEVVVLLGRYEKSPDAERWLPPSCEYLILHYPKDEGTRTMCRSMIETLADNTKLSADERKAQWDEEWNGGPPWVHVLKAAWPDALKLFRIYASKRKRP